MSRENDFEVRLNACCTLEDLNALQDDPTLVMDEDQSLQFYNTYMNVLFQDEGTHTVLLTDECICRSYTLFYMNI